MVEGDYYLLQSAVGSTLTRTRDVVTCHEHNSEISLSDVFLLLYDCYTDYYQKYYQRGNCRKMKGKSLYY